MSPLTWWAFWIWQTADDTFELALADYQLHSLPYTTQEHDPNEPVPLLSPEETAAYEGHLIKICTSSPTIVPVGGAVLSPRSTSRAGRSRPPIHPRTWWCCTSRSW